MEYKRTLNSPSMDVSREELAEVAYMCYVLNHTETTRWYYRWRTCLERMADEGWTRAGLHYRGLLVQKLEHTYGLSPRQSRTAVRQYPLVNMGIEPWQVLTEQSANELAEKIYRAYVGLPQEKGCSFCSGYADADRADNCDNCSDQNIDINLDCTDDEQDMGGFYFI